MLFYELACHPEVFSRDFLVSHEIEQGYLEQILINTVDNGSIADFDNGEWKNLIIRNIDNLNDALDIKRELQILLKTLENRNRFIKYPATNAIQGWSEKISYFNQKIPFFAILDTLTNEDKFLPKALARSYKWKNVRAISTKYAKQDNFYMKSEISPILYNSREIDIIDPYFDVRKPNYKSSLDIVVSALLEGQIKIQEKIIKIHIKNHNNEGVDIADDNNYLELWQSTFKKYNKDIKFVLNVWKETTNDKMHDRFIFRDEGFGIILPSGVDGRPKNKTAWNIVEDRNIDFILNDHRIDSSPYDLVAEVMVAEIKIWKNGVLQQNTNLSIEEKLKNVKKLGGRRMRPNIS